MILFLSSWHILIVIGVFLGCSAFLAAMGILSLLWGVWKQIEREDNGWEQARRERRSAAAKKGHVTRWARAERRRFEEQSLARNRAAGEITPDDALGFIRGEDQHAK